MQNDSGDYVVRGVSTKRQDGEYAVLLDSTDLVEWLQAKHGLDDVELSLCKEMADQISFMAIAILSNELDEQGKG